MMTMSTGIRWANRAVVTLLAIGVATAGAEEPRRIVIRGHGAFAHYLRERLPVDVHVQVDDHRDRSLNLFLEMGIGPSDTPVTDPGTHARYCAYSPVDALIFVQQAATSPRDLTLIIHRPGRVWQKHFPYTPNKPGSFLAMTREALACVADECGFSPEEKAALLKIGFTNDEVFRQYDAAKYVLNHHESIENLGMSKIRILLNVLPKDPTNPILAAEILKNADLVHKGGNIAACSDRVTTISQKLLPLVLGTPCEAAAHPILQRFPERFDSVLLQQCAPLTKSLDTEISAATKSVSDLGLDEAAMDVNIDVTPTPERTRGALRLLGIVKSKPGLPILISTAKHADPLLRETAADGLAGYDDKTALDSLRTLAGDRDDRVACAAVLGLWGRQICHDRLLSLVRTRTGVNDPRKARALAVLETLGETQDAPALRRLCADPNAALRLGAVRGLIRLKAMDDATLARLLADGQTSVLALALSALPAQPDATVMAQVKRLANDPDETLAELARMSVMPFRPKDQRGGIVFDLQMEHTYIRLRRIEQLCGIREAWATDLLDAGCSNRNVYVRAAVLAGMMQRDPVRGHDCAVRALSDTDTWMRFAAAETLAKVAIPADAITVRKALESEKDLATRIGLSEALAKAEGKPPPPPQSPARSIQGAQITVWNGRAGADSPFNAQFERDFRKKMEEEAAELHKSGTFIFGRLWPVYNPGSLAVDRKARDECWKNIDMTLTVTNLAFTDGYVFGEATMSTDAEALWPAGWRLFCLDAGLDPTRVRGVQTNLTVTEQRAWADWANARCVDGFNELYDYVKGKVAKLRPGIQVCTFLPMPGAKFDAVGMFHLKGDNRLTTYNLVRDYKTLWPDRPVICFSWGVCEEKNIVQRGHVFPTSPIIRRHDRAYADAITAYMAGADVGWWSYWVAHDPTWKEGDAEKGQGLSPGSLFTDSAVLSNALDHVFQNVAKLDSAKADQKKKPALDDLSDLDLDAEEHAAGAAKEQIAGIEAEKTVMYRGFLYYGMYLRDCARVFAGLPRQHPKPEALAIRPNDGIWSVSEKDAPQIPGMALLNQYDFLCDLNQTATLDLSRYRLIMVHNPGGLLRDATLAALTRWLKEQPGLLYIHDDIETDNAAEASVIGDMDGVLKNDWPWEADLTMVTTTNAVPLKAVKGIGLDVQPAMTAARSVCAYTPRNESARVLASTADGKPLLVLWRRPETFKGVVLFDGVANAPKAYIEALRGVINQLQKDSGIGLALGGPILHEVLDTTNLLAAATTRYYAEAKDVKTYKGLDLLTGQLDPVVGEGSSGVMIGREFIGRFVASLSGLAILSTRPLGKIERMESGIRMQNDGLVRVASETGRVTIKPEGGAVLPTVKDPNTWLILGTDEGVATLPVKGSAPLTYYRCSRPVTITSK